MSKWRGGRHMKWKPTPNMNCIVPTPKHSIPELFAMEMSKLEKLTRTGNHHHARFAWLVWLCRR